MPAPRVAILQQCFVPRYRVRFYEQLHQQSEIEYVVFCGPAPKGTGHVAMPGPFEFPAVWTDTRQLAVSQRVWTYQPIIRRLMSTRWDGIVVAPWMRSVSNLVLAPLFKARGRAVIAWGHGYEREQDDGAAASAALSVAAALKRAFARSVDGYLLETYTDRGAESLASIGVAPERIHPVWNTIDMEEQIELHARRADADPAALRDSLGLRRDSAVLLCIGRLYREKRVHQLVDAVRVAQGLTDTPIETIVIGEGPELPRVRAAAVGVPGFSFLGTVHDQDLLADYMRVSTALVVPGVVSLVINQAFAHGLPVVTVESGVHGPEVTYLEPGVNGLVVPGGIDELGSALAELVDSPERRRELSDGALRTRSRLSLDDMVRDFDRGVAASLGVGSPTGSGTRPRQDSNLRPAA